MVSRNYEPMPRRWHTSAQVAKKVVVYSGETSDDRKQTAQSASVVEVFSPQSEQWDAKQCTGDIPATGLYLAASAAVNNHLYTYGGRDRDGNLLDSMHQLNTKTYDWPKLSPRNTKGECPMPKYGAAMIAYGDNLALLGGKGLPLDTTQRESSFIKDTKCSDGKGWTNEFHIYHLSEGVWSSPATTGDRPPPCAYFSLTSIDNRRAVMFGGYNGEQGLMNDVYIIDLQSMRWTKVNKSGRGPWPGERWEHAACCLNYGQQNPQLLVTGGRNREGYAQGDAWILDVGRRRWRKVKDILQPRRGHSSTAININATLTEVIMFGGRDDSYTPLAGTTVLQFRLKGHSWELSGVVGPTELGRSEERLREKMEYGTRKLSLLWKMVKTGTPYTLALLFLIAVFWVINTSTGITTQPWLSPAEYDMRTQDTKGPSSVEYGMRTQDTKVCTEITEVRQLFQALEKFPQWTDLGRELDVSEGEVQEIDYDYRSTPEKRRALLQMWFDRQTRACWEHITRALKAIERNNLAMTIENKYITVSRT